MKEPKTPDRLDPALRVTNVSEVEGRTGVVPGQTYQSLVGVPERPTDRVRLGRATYQPHTVEPLHWHPIEALYYVIAGGATVRNVVGTEYDVSAGSFIYAPAGIEGAHEWEVKESLELLDIRATNVTNRKFQFTVDKASMRSYIDLSELDRRDGLRFESHY
jgi:quercetin dioxygenase-like cupin family protein